MDKNIQNQQTLFINKAEIDSVFNAQVNNRWNVGQTSTSERIKKLKKLENWIINNKQAIRDALFNDLKKPPTEVDITEMAVSWLEIRHAIRHLRKWTKPKRVKRTIIYLTALKRYRLARISGRRPDSVIFPVIIATNILIC